ncbi:transcriptional regulator [Sinomicrobium pectinilyticum]|uniref:Transcriptional regulator n=1 Tax=Sinomicrobium pectinilyticum TaxID=1084421 RepID=A0A3N0DS03_SINP1|nr:tetratricopeptide repeat protein [Sinomicrobium pectinilyticum]RNL78143.1 transcriptional regulator [Sinomicrobium pectinilyticum]
MLPFFCSGQGTSEKYGNDTLQDSLFYTCKTELREAIKEGMPGIAARKHMQLGDFYRKNEVFTEAIGQYNKAMEMLAGAPEDSINSILNRKIGEIYLTLKIFSKARQYFDTSKAIALAGKYKRGQAKAEGLLGTCSEKEGNYLRALEHQQKSLELFRQINDQRGIAFVNENIGSIYEDLKQYDIAHKHFSRALAYFEGRNDEAQISVLNNMGDMFRKTGNYTEALEYTSQALQLAMENNNLHQQKSAHQDLSEVYAEIKDYQKAYEHLTVYEAMYKEMSRNRDINNFNTLQTAYEINQKEAQIELLRHQNEAITANRNLILVTTLALLLLSGLLYIYFLRKRKEKVKLQQYKQRLLQAELEKREIEEKKLQDEISLKTASLSRYSLNMAQKNKLIADMASTLKNIASRKQMDVHTKIRSLARELDANLQMEEEWDEFMGFFKDIHPRFFKKLSALTTEKLSSAELRLAMLLRLNLSSKEIAPILRVTPDSVRVARYRLRKKIPIPAKQELVSFLMEL